MKQINFEGYIEKIKKRTPTTNARTRMQEIAEPYLKYILWENKTLHKDTRLLYIYLSKYYNKRTEHQFINMLEWVKEVNKLHPKQVIKSIVKLLDEKKKKNPHMV